MTTTAIAHPNIALVKYWGKQDKPGNFPATPNLSITLSELTTQTSVSDNEQDEFWLNDQLISDTKVEKFLQQLRAEHDVPGLKIESSNNFPTGAGLASSASGFAALITAINQHAKLGLNAESLSQWARLGSASAARSIFGGVVALMPPVWRAESIFSTSHWPLETVVAITSDAKKTIGSTQGMQRSRDTSVFYRQWVSTSSDDFAVAYEAINDRNFNSLAVIAELSCLKMHSVMLTSIPTLSYWNPATIACMDTVRSLRADGVDVFFTIDAGPQVKAICLPESTTAVEHALQATPGVQRTVRCGMGAGAQIITS